MSLGQERRRGEESVYEMPKKSSGGVWARRSRRERSERGGGGRRNEQVWEEWERQEHRVLKKKNMEMKEATAEPHLEERCLSERSWEEEEEEEEVYVLKQGERQGEEASERSQ